MRGPFLGINTKETVLKKRKKNIYLKSTCTCTCSYSYVLNKTKQNNEKILNKTVFHVEGIKRIKKKYVIRATDASSVRLKYWV